MKDVITSCMTLCDSHSVKTTDVAVLADSNQVHCIVTSAVTIQVMHSERIQVTMISNHQ